MKTTLQILCLTLLALLVGACGNNSDENSNEDCNCYSQNWICVSVLDQWDEQMSCIYNYDFGTRAKGLEGEKQCDEDEEECTEDQRQCAEGELLIIGNPGNYRVNAQCDGLIGHIQVPLEPFNEEHPTDELYTSRLVNSLCYKDPYQDQPPIIMDPDNNEVRLGEWLGYSTNNRCANWFGHDEVYATEVSAFTLKTCDPDGNCEETDGADYLHIKGRWGLYTDGWPIHLTVVANTDLVTPGQEVTVIVTIREMYAPEQELELPIIIRGNEAEE